MLWTITLILFVGWLVGVFSGAVVSGWIHLLLLLAVVMLLMGIIQGRRVV